MTYDREAERRREEQREEEYREQRRQEAREDVAEPKGDVQGDAARLDWVQSFIRRHDRMPEFHPDWANLREAIDAAMQAGKGAL